MANEDGMWPLDKRCADALADEVDLLVRKKVIDSRSPAADALLDYRNPPTSPRSDRLLDVEWALARARDAIAILYVGNGARLPDGKVDVDKVINGILGGPT